VTHVSERKVSPDVVGRSSALVPLLRENAVATEKAHRLAPGNVEALAEAGVFKLTVPRRFGGFEADLATQNVVMENLARGCGSTAWVCTVCTACIWMVGLFPDATQDEVFETPCVRVAGVLAAAATATRRDGGYVVSGRWPFNTGCLDAHWAALGVPLGSGDDPQLAIALIPYSELRILDDWYVTGLAGTGSNTVVAEEVFVPDHHLLPVERASREDYLSERNADSPLFRYALAPFLVAGSASTAIGLAREAMDVFVERASRRGITYTAYERQADAPIAHLELGEAALKVEAAALLRDRASALVMDKAVRSETWTTRERVEVRAHTAYAVRLAKEAVQLLFDASGATSLREDVPMQRLARDLQAISLHSLLLPSTNVELLGRTLFGLEPNSFPL
jgi:alkylation response protein AidB-like acyl-CoA dehydrogenase